MKSNSQWNWNIEAENTVSQLLFVDAWIGPRKFESKDEVVFDRIFVGINGVSEWYEYGYEKAITTSSERERSVQMVVPKPILIYDLFLRWCWQDFFPLRFLVLQRLSPWLLLFVNLFLKLG